MELCAIFFFILRIVFFFFIMIRFLIFHTIVSVDTFQFD